MKSRWMAFQRCRCRRRLRCCDGRRWIGAFDRGIRHVYIKPAAPRLNGKVERSGRIDEEEFSRVLDGVAIDDTALFNDKLQEWEGFYNFNQPTEASTDRPLRTTKTEGSEPTDVTGHRQLHTNLLPVSEPRRYSGRPHRAAVARPSLRPATPIWSHIARSLRRACLSEQPNSPARSATLAPSSS